MFKPPPNSSMKARIGSKKEVEFGEENGFNTLELCAIVLLWFTGAQENLLIGRKKKKKTRLGWLGSMSRYCSLFDFLILWSISQSSIPVATHASSKWPRSSSLGNDSHCVMYLQLLSFL